MKLPRAAMGGYMYVVSDCGILFLVVLFILL